MRSLVCYWRLKWQKFTFKDHWIASTLRCLTGTSLAAWVGWWLWWACWWCWCGGGGGVRPEVQWGCGSWTHSGGCVNGGVAMVAAGNWACSTAQHQCGSCSCCCCVYLSLSLSLCVCLCVMSLHMSMTPSVSCSALHWCACHDLWQPCHFLLVLLLFWFTTPASPQAPTCVVTSTQDRLLEHSCLREKVDGN